MRTLSLALLGLAAIALAGCEKTIHEAKADRPSLESPTAAEHPAPRVVPAVDGVPIA